MHIEVKQNLEIFLRLSVFFPDIELIHMPCRAGQKKNMTHCQGRTGQGTAGHQGRAGQGTAGHQGRAGQKKVPCDGL
jgi:hypothetical protein